MKPTAYLINTSRGAVVDLPALVNALEQGWIAGAALDVFDPEPLPKDHPLFDRPNIITTPHMAFYSQESMLDLEIKAAQNIVDIFSGKRPASIVNPEVLLLPRWSHLR
jgi:D-3-phosphoglycerate dehydrogenase